MQRARVNLAKVFLAGCWGVCVRGVVVVGVFVGALLGEVRAADEIVLHPLPATILQDQVGGVVSSGPRVSAAATVRWEQGVELAVVQVGTPVRPELEGQERVQLAALVAGVETFETDQNRGITHLAIAGLAMSRVAPSWTSQLTPEGLLFRASVRVEDVAASVQQLVDVLREVPFDEGLFETHRASAIARREALEASANQAIGDVMAQQLSPSDDPRLRRATAAELKRTTAQQAHQQLKTHFSQRRIDLAAVSTARLATVIRTIDPHVQPLLTSPAGERLVRSDGPESLRRPVRSEATMRQVIQGPGVPGTLLMTLTQPAPMQADVAAVQRTVVAARVLQEQLRSVLERMPAESPLAGAKIMGITPIPGRTYVTLGVTVVTVAVGVGEDGGARAKVVMEQVAELVDQVAREPVSDEVIAKARSELAREQRRRLSQFDGLAHALATARYAGVGTQGLLMGAGGVEAVGYEAVRETLRQEFAGVKRSIVVLQPGG